MGPTGTESVQTNIHGDVATLGGFRLIDRCLPQDSMVFSACYIFPNVSQLSLAFPIPDALLFAM
jgi:hypothetical protein